MGWSSLIFKDCKKFYVLPHNNQNSLYPYE